MRGTKRLGVSSIVLISLIIASCGGESTATSDMVPAPATEAEIEAFCERNEEAKDLDYETRYSQLLEVAPEELKAPLTRMISNPGPTDDDFLVEDFIETHCDN